MTTLEITVPDATAAEAEAELQTIIDDSTEYDLVGSISSGTSGSAAWAKATIEWES